MNAMKNSRVLSFEDLPKVKTVRINSEGQELWGYQAIINPDTFHVFDIPTEAYKLVSHQEMIERTEEKLNKMTSTLGPFEREIRIDGEGERMRVKYQFNNCPIEFTSSHRNEVINPTVEAMNSYNRSWKNQIFIGAMRLVCTNGLMIGERWGSFKKRHIKSLNLEEMEGSLIEGFQKVTQTAIEWKNWSELPVAKDQVEETIKKLDLGSRETKLLMEEQEVSTSLSLEDWMLFQELEMRQEMVERMNKWVFFNILTQFITHQVATELRRFQLQSRVADIFYN